MGGGGGRITFDLDLVVILLLLVTPLDGGEGKLVFLLWKVLSGVFRIWEVDLDGVPAISVLLSSLVHERPCSTGFADFTVLADFSAACWAIVLEKNCLLVSRDGVLAFQFLLLNPEYDRSAW